MRANFYLLDRMNLLTQFEKIDQTKWSKLVKESKTATWFQTAEAYSFYASQPDLFAPFVIAVTGESLRGVIVGYITKEKNALKQFATRRAIIIGGPLLAEDIREDELRVLLNTTKRHIGKRAIYIETRNFHDYSQWRSVFEQCGWEYEEHLNFHIDCSSQEIMEANISKNRKRDIKFSFRDGATIIEHPTKEQIKTYYQILKHLYTTKVKTPLFPLSFFEKLYDCPSARFLLVEFNGEVVGGTVCVCLEGKAMYEWYVCGRDGEWKSIFPSSVATYAGIYYAATHNYPIFDMMGAGTPKDAYGVRDFKARFGGQLVEHGRYLYITSKILFIIGKIGVKLLKKI